MEQGAKTALGSARERFIEGLSRRADELRAAIGAVRPVHDGSAAREELQRKLHTLLASAQLFERTALAEQLQRVTTRLDAASKAGETWTDGDFGLLEGLVVQLASERLDRGSMPAVSKPADSGEVLRARAREGDGESASPSTARSLIASNVVRPTPRTDIHEPVSIDLSWRAPARTLPVPVPGDLDKPEDPAQELAEVPLLVTKTQSGSTAAPGLARLLLICSRPHAVKLREWFDGSPLEIVHAADAEHAVQQLHAAGPALALLSAEYANLPDIDLVRRLQTDPLSKLSWVYVLLPEGSTYDDAYLRQTGADGVLVEPLGAPQIDALVQQCMRPGRGGLRALSALGEPTVDDIASYLAEEIRSGIADALRSGQNERIRIGDSHELKSAAWSAIGRVRSHLAEQSRGRVAFRDDEIHELSQFLEPERSAAPGADALKDLAGKRVLVADDDPAVMWFFSGLLREGGAQVLQAQNGRDALALARRKQPQLVLSDILMPKIDGFALCRELQRDALLAHVPVILLSWKDDYLERMRELDAGASGYLRKEAGTKEVLAAINQALRPRQQLVAALRADHELRGRIDGLGVFALLESVAAVRPDARVAIQDAWNVFEVDIRNGQRLSVTRTAADGSFARAERALVQLLGVSTGRFAISPGNSSLRSPLAEPIGSALMNAGKALTALMHAVSDTRLVQVARLSFEDDVVESLQKRMPTRLYEVVARFKRGANARDLLLEGSFTPAELENHLRELARRGAISGVWNAEDEDMVAAARREREEQPGSLQHSAHPPSSQTAWFSSLRPQRSSEKRDSSRPPSAFSVGAELLADLEETDEALRQLAAGSSSLQEPPPAGDGSALGDSSTQFATHSARVERAADIASARADSSTQFATHAARVDAPAGTGSARGDASTQFAREMSAEVATISARAEEPPAALSPSHRPPPLPGSSLRSRPLSGEPPRAAAVGASSVGVSSQPPAAAVSSGSAAPASAASSSILPPPLAAAPLPATARGRVPTPLGISGPLPPLGVPATLPPPLRPRSAPPPPLGTSVGLAPPPPSGASSLPPPPPLGASQRPALPAAAGATLPQTFVSRSRVPTPLGVGGPPGNELRSAPGTDPADARAQAASESEAHPNPNQTLPQHFGPAVQARASIVVGPQLTAAAIDEQPAAHLHPSAEDLAELLPPEPEPYAPRHWSRAVELGLSTRQPSGVARERAPAAVGGVAPGASGAPLDASAPSPARLQSSAPSTPAARAASGWPLDLGVRLPSPLPPPPSAAEDSQLLRVASQLSEVDHAYLSDSAQRRLAEDTSDPRWTDEDTSISELRRAGFGRWRRWSEAFEGARLILTLAVLAALGYFGWQRYEASRRAVALPAPSAETAPTFSSNTTSAPVSSAPPAAPPGFEPAPNAASSSDPSETALHSATDPDLSLGRILPYVDASRGVSVGPQQGLLVIEYQGDNPSPKIRVAGRELGHPPLAVALSAGRHELVVQRNRESSFRYLVVRPGQTRVITLPL